MSVEALQVALSALKDTYWPYIVRALGNPATSLLFDLIDPACLNLPTSLKELQQRTKQNFIRFHAVAPNDELQSEAMGLCHSLFCEASNGKLFLAELPDNAQKILDVGTGTGAWAIEVGEAHPHALVIGTDLSPIQPQHVPPNVEFQIDDFNEPWTFKDNSLDYINMRFLTGSVRDWKFLVGEAYRCLKEDGILESSEPSFLIESDDGTVDQTSA
ncbi:uncharacterized protein CCOS01_17116 [Colletotrichum costaricense]|uniref:Methyltransferase domain-containing protein n=1 Tax=Colletotrichum costaricense TaxID=1209916 RepID=A0AAJ0DR63_9PEZI|nr:uncharacterized protein CCOS01_17116 [Colletotrichum costaricense]KAK1502281.1 hypothetical protein CCOS01_17116 [Colletotrichum costaricense]